MNLKNYQQQTLETLSKFLTQAKILGIEEAFKLNRNAPNYSAEYFKLPNLEGVPYVCLRLPTGGGKTLLASYSIKLAAENFIERDFPVVLWLVPTDIIRQQTLKLLRDTRSFYRQVLDDAFKMQVKIFDITEFRTLRPQDLFQSLNIFVVTFQSFRVTNTEGRKVYQSNEFLEPCFRDIPQQNYFQVSENGGYKSFGNLLAYLRPLMIIDEAHNYSSELSLDSCICHSQIWTNTFEKVNSPAYYTPLSDCLKKSHQVKRLKRNLSLSDYLYNYNPPFQKSLSICPPARRRCRRSIVLPCLALISSGAIILIHW